MLLTLIDKDRYAAVNRTKLATMLDHLTLHKNLKEFPLRPSVML